jgi:hypothetical protein
MKLKVSINFSLLFSIINGTKRFHRYHNEYGWELAWNIIPKRFGLFFAICKEVRR